MTLHIRQPIPGTEVETLVDAAFASKDTHLYRDVLKRAFDVALVLLAAIPVVLVIGICALLVARDGGSPFYRQTRIGRYGRKFEMLKLRTMVKNADTKLAAYLDANPAARAEWDHSQKLKNDPRITRVGAFLRKTSLDELPQLWNVLTGDMSLVGPRPMMVDQQAMYPGAAYYALRPGLTGFWQVSVRHESGFAERAAYDSDYLQKVSLRTDIDVMVKTVGVISKATGC